MSAPNGVAPEGAALDPLARIRDELEDTLRPLRERKAELQAALTEVAGQEQRIVNALLALGGQKPGESEPRRQPGENTGKNWMPSKEKIEKVYLGLKAAAEPVGARRLGEITGFSPETCNRALRALREQERARLVGVTGQGGARTYALMPGADDGA
jgi:hypothetical protein